MTGTNRGTSATARTRPSAAMRIAVGAALWTALISVAHVATNVGFATFGEQARVFFGLERRSLRVGFLPVT